MDVPPTEMPKPFSFRCSDIFSARERACVTVLLQVRLFMPSCATPPAQDHFLMTLTHRSLPPHPGPGQLEKDAAIERRDAELARRGLARKKNIERAEAVDMYAAQVRPYLARI